MWYEIIIVFLSQIDWMDVLLELCLFTCLKPLSLLEAPVCVIVGVELKICEEPPAGAAFKSWACKVFWATPVTVYATKPINRVSRHLNRSHCCHSRTTVLLWRLKTSITPVLYIYKYDPFTYLLLHVSNVAFKWHRGDVRESVLWSVLKYFLLWPYSVMFRLSKCFFSRKD